MEYRLAKKEDAEKVVEIHYKAVLAVSSEIYSNAIKEAWSPLPSKSRVKRIVSAIKSPDYCFFVALDKNKEIIGFAIFSISNKFLQAIYVDPDVTGRGIGSALLSQVEEAAKNLGIDTIELKASLNAEPFYLKSGYMKICDSTQELVNGVLMSSITMKKNIK